MDKNIELDKVKDKQFCVVHPWHGTVHNIKTEELDKYTSMKPEDIGPLSERLSNRKAMAHSREHIINAGVFYRDEE